MKKKCSKCGVEKDLNEFYKSTGKHKFGVMAWCKVCYCEESKITHTKAGRNRYYLKTYNITEAEFNRMKHEQNGMCQICGEATNLVVDHNHKSGKVRGLLCNSCNAGIGMFFENFTNLENAKKYLEKYE